MKNDLGLWINTQKVDEEISKWIVHLLHKKNPRKLSVVYQFVADTFHYKKLVLSWYYKR